MRFDKTALALFVLASCVALSAGPAVADTYTVSPDGLGDYPTIQAAVDDAGDGDVIELTDGTFTGDGNRDIVIPSVNITVRSQSGVPEQCIINCDGSARAAHRGFRLTWAGTGDVTLEGIGMINGYVTEDGGGGIWLDGADATIVNCVIASCEAGGVPVKRGGGLYVTGGAIPTIENCIVTGCKGNYGAGISISGSGGTYEACSIIDNEATDVGGGFYVSALGPHVIRECIIVSNSAARAAGVYLSGGSATMVDCDVCRNEATQHSGGVWLGGGFITGCTIVDNSAATGASGIYCLAGTGSVDESIIAFSESGYGVGADSPGNVPTLTCCDVYGNPAGDYDAVVGDQTGANGNISQDPLICGYQSEDYTLDALSPCLPGGNGCAVLMGAHGQGCDTPVEAASWGRLKGMYR